MRFQMARHLGWLTREQPSARPRMPSAPFATASAAKNPLPKFSRRDYLSYLLYIDAEIEQGLLVQYLDGIEVAPPLRLVSDANNFGQVIERWARFVPTATAVRILSRLLGHGSLQSEANSPSMRLN